MSAITTHILDTTSGKAGAGIPVVLERRTHTAGWQAIAEGIT
ncbi:MAG: hydroxyisourate hydrolase, partial [Pyrinomonadaceae bacterium]|nr:hydroxyisourate hydrolase [Pyrinomonadaceae bacterium]